MRPWAAERYLTGAKIRCWRRRLAQLLCILSVCIPPAAGIGTEADMTRITVVYNNVPHDPDLTTAWGFAAVVETGTRTALFDTGGDGPVLLGNMRRLGIDPQAIDVVVLSHIHGDHTGGLDDFLAVRPDVTIYMPASFPAAFRRAAERHGARIETVDAPRRLFSNLHSTGEMGDGTDEQALIVDTASGLVVMTGCAHPGIVEITAAARSYLKKDIRLLLGGFHLGGRSPDENRATVAALRKLKVHSVAPSHCTGDQAIALFRAAWGDDFVEGGCGAVINLP